MANEVFTARRFDGIGAPALARPVPGAFGYGVLIAASAIYYYFLLSNGTFQLFAPEFLDGVFNHMLLNLLQGDLTIAREVIASEAFTRSGKTYAYFGIFPALLRLFALPFTDLADAHLARLSCIIAMLLFVAAQLRSIILVHANASGGTASQWWLWLMLAATLLSGPQLYLLGSAWIFHEPVFWAAALAAIFNYVILRAVLGHTALNGRDLTLLALLAGLGLHTRASVGVGLCLGVTLLLIWMTLRWHSGLATGSIASRLLAVAAALPRALLDGRIMIPVLVLALFAAAVGLVNYLRWDNPLVFADFRYYDFAHRQPHRLEVIRTYGEINFGRVWVSALYYATGIPYVLKSVSPFAEFLRARFDGLEAPPITGLLTNPLTVLFAGYGLYRLRPSSGLAVDAVAVLRLVLVGHAAVIVLILGAMYLTLRYRLDFAGFMTLAALIGYRAFLVERATTFGARRTVRGFTALLCAGGIVASHYVLVIHKVWSRGVPMPVRQALLPFAPFARAALEP